MSVGAIQGVWNAATGTLWGLVALAKLPYTTLRAATEFQAQVWSSFDASEKDAFAQDTGLLVAAILDRNATLGKEDAQKLIAQVNQTVLTDMTKLENDWQVGDYQTTAKEYASFATDQIASIAMPVIMAKLAKSNVALNALNKAQSAVQTAMAPLLAGLGTLNTVEELMPVLNALKSGLELTPAQVTQLYGITADELAEYQSIADKYQLLITVRSRAYSSIQWISDALAMLKPEALKIKTVNVLDTKLGYAESLEGSLVFQEPEPLVEWKKSGGAISSYVQSFVESKGFAPGTGEYYDAINRVSLRISEYNKWAESYFKWSERGWIDTTFNWDGNAVTTATRTAMEEKVGFRLRPVGNNTWIIEMQNPKTGQFVPVTGDIDAIAYTNLDGSPLTEAQHADVLDAVRKNELIQAQHGESATYVNGGVDFVQDQFKPNEPGLQLAPGWVAPRIVRLNTKQSRWVNAGNYNLSWDGGYISAGSPLPVAATGFIAPQISTAMDAATDTSPVPTTLPGIAPSIGGANVGRCLMTFANDATAVPLVMNADGSLATVGADGQVQDDKSLDKKCFSEGRSRRSASHR